ncbi:unnamed protein product [marine sediment metagenome]|uniref:Uncharacterized protein n=1 Tax=marine sediment metagenome TaxID=412755 RepID=X1KL82_9ZZZZ
MTTRSTRNKLRHQAEKVMNDLDRCQGHLRYLSELSGGESPYIEKHMPDIVLMVDVLKKIIKQFREGL